MKTLLFIVPFFYLAANAQAKPEVMVHEGSELLSVIHLLSDSAEVTKSTYHQAILAYFRPFKDHEAVKMARELPFINCDFPVRLSWVFYNFPKIKYHQPDTLLGYEKYFKKDQVQRYLKACVDFYNDSRFWKFYQTYASEYAKWVATFNQNLYKEKMLPIINDFYRLPASKITFTLGALNCGTYAIPDLGLVNPQFKGQTLVMVAYGNIIGNKESGELDPNFHSPKFANQLIWHETGHAYLRTLFRLNAAKISEMKSIFNNDPIMQKEAGNMGWPMYLEENVTQAVTSVLRIKNGVMSREEELKRITSGKFYVFVPRLVQLIEQEYLDNRDYKDFGVFFPRLLDGLSANYKQ